MIYTQQYTTTVPKKMCDLCMAHKNDKIKPNRFSQVYLLLYGKTLNKYKKFPLFLMVSPF